MRDRILTVFLQPGFGIVFGQTSRRTAELLQNTLVVELCQLNQGGRHCVRCHSQIFPSNPPASAWIARRV
jgi:hypothetical protein